MKKVLVCASTVSHINNFHLPYLKAFHDMGYEVHVVAAADESVTIQWADKVFALPFHKKLHSLKNVLCIYQARKLLKAQCYEKVSTNTTLASVIMRIAAIFVKDRPRIYNIVHGYLFNLNPSLRKYLYLIPEKIAASVTDIVMVMNYEDLEIAKKYKLYKDKLYMIDGMGVDPLRFKYVSQQEKSKEKKRMGFALDDFLFVYAAEFSERKNQRVLIESFAKCRMEKGHLLLAGDGKTLDECKRLAKQLGQTSRVHFLGYVNDVPALYTACDVAVSTSLIEGLPFNIIEAISCGLPVVASDIKGHRELVKHNVNGLLFQVQNRRELSTCLIEIYTCGLDQRLRYGQAGNKKAKTFMLGSILGQIMNIYTESSFQDNPSNTN